MDNPRGRVLSFVERRDGAHALVSVDQAPTCPRCAAGKGCGAGIFTAGGGEREVEATVPDGLRLQIDDRVELSLAPDNVLRAALTVYGIPMLGALMGAAVAYAAGFGDIGAAATALIGLGTGLLISRWRLAQGDCLRQFTPSVERRC